MSDRLTEIRARLDAIDASDPQSCWAFVVRAPGDVEWMLDRTERMRHALSAMCEMAQWGGTGVGRRSIDGVLRDFGLSLAWVEADDV